MRHTLPLRAWRRWLLALGLVAAAASVGGAAETPAPGGVPRPVLETGRGGQCVADPDFMRRNHAQLLKHQRDDTVLKGIRTPRFSLAGCVACHAGSKTGSVIATEQDFCASCHRYTAVKLDCFECHADRPGAGAARALASKGVP
ncbi:MAG TPA: hypothetical protein VF814_20640 [Casimicrobiaceae bacterium]